VLRKIDFLLNRFATVFNSVALVEASYLRTGLTNETG